MSRIVAIFALLTFGCTGSPAPAPAAPQPSAGTSASESPAAGASTAGARDDTSAPGASAAGSDECPAVTEPCMNEENHADCVAVAASCTGHVTQLESCPLQFACEKTSP